MIFFIILVDFKTLRAMAIYCLFVTVPPARPQNGRLLFLEGNEVQDSLDQMRERVKVYNSNISPKKTNSQSLTGVFYLVCICF